MLNPKITPIVRKKTHSNSLHPPGDIEIGQRGVPERKTALDEQLEAGRAQQLPLVHRRLVVLLQLHARHLHVFQL